MGAETSTLLIVAIALVVVSFFSDWIERRHYVYAVIATIATCIIVAALSAAYQAESNSGTSDFWRTAALFFGPTLVAIGWVVTNEVTTLNSRKQHTITLINQYFTNAQRIEDKRKIAQRLAGRLIIDPTVYDFDDHTHPFLTTVQRELNYLDFLASSILRREVDEGLLKRVLRDILLRHHDQLLPYIKHCQCRSPDTWADFSKLYDRWTSR
jgi:hypothetical protein